MLPFNVRKLDRGFTLIEMIAVTAILSIVAALAVPNVLGMLNRNQANSALGEIEGAIKEAQKLAIRNGQSCTLNIIAATRTVSGTCLIRNRVFQAPVSLPNGDQTIIFSGKGNTSNGITVRVSLDNNANVDRCLTVATGLGIMRTGDMNGGNCVTRN
ncbi:type II secretion system protein [Waterburya agarophytonicola K14]|uniref:Type II secretion system protein n=1 Tax=Waterburya agarophytonicola KI4 TaxID=2874699 RepID=A0A964BSV7_9CYAN|nr:type II secretion system protein [Waterburya agarophytonicola]MCC0177923.1 type II secretion system protein [Waterburya agarophytonicola KI4]